jgi:hypothetical protein
MIISILAYTSQIWVCNSDPVHWPEFITQIQLPDPSLLLASSSLAWVYYSGPAGCFFLYC